jgi:hypothetical protein
MKEYLTVGKLQKLLEGLDSETRIVVSGNNGTGYDDISGCDLVEIGLNALSGTYQGEHENIDWLDEKQKQSLDIVKAIYLK